LKKEYLDWLDKSRNKWSHNNDFWDFKYQLSKDKSLLSKLSMSVATATHDFSPARRVIKTNGDITTIWDAKDSLALKYLAENIKAKSNFSKFVVSNKGNGGIPKAIKTVNKLIKTHKYIYRSDVKSFYNSINHKILLEELPKYTKPNEYKLIAKHLDRIEWQDGEYVEIKQGISKSSPLSPLLGCIYLDKLDQAMEKMDIKYLRYADDWIILAKTKHKLRKAVKKCKQILTSLKLKEHPDKTDYRNYQDFSLLLAIDCEHGSNLITSNKNEDFVSKQPFDFLGVEFNHNGAKDIKNETKQNFSIKISRLYEYIQAIASRKNTINTAYTKGKNLYDYINRLELEMIKKFIRSVNGFCRYRRNVL
jgi:RNA-directed DNA polymerase